MIVFVNIFLHIYECSANICISRSRNYRRLWSQKYANEGGWHYLATGVVGYISLVILLIIALQGSTILLVNNAWDGASSILESLFAFFILGERFDNYLQYLGIVMIIGGMSLLKIPWKKSHSFHIPHLT